ncbi:hypothetical protein KBC03_06675 [Patescibacteria group bacterium]|nr:hypothetical protein [Patescibacteria group bacterium]
MENRSLTSPQHVYYIWAVYEHILEEALTKRPKHENAIAKIFAEKERVCVNRKVVLFDESLCRDLILLIEKKNMSNTWHLAMCRIAFILFPLLCTPAIVYATGLYPVYKTIGMGVGLCVISYIVYKKIYLRERRDRLQIRQLVYDQCKNKLT